MDKDEVLKLAKLARIDISDSEAEELTKEFEPILDYVGQVKEALKGVNKESGIRNKGELPIHNIMREDENPHEGNLYTEDLLNVAPNREGRFVKVKKIL